MRLYANDSSLFTCVNGITQTHDKLGNELQTIRCGLISGKWFLTPVDMPPCTYLIISLNATRYVLIFVIGLFPIISGVCNP